MDFNLVKKYFDYKSKLSSDFQIISDVTAYDLDVDLIFYKLNKTRSKIGQQFLYNKFRTINKEEDILLESYVDYFKNDKGDVISAQLEKLNQYNDYEIVDLIINDLILEGKFLSYAKLSILALILILIISVFTPQILLFLIPLFMGNAFFHYRNKKYVEFYNSIISRLSKTFQVARKIGKIEQFKAEYEQLNFRKIESSIWFSTFSASLAKNELLSVFWFLIELFRISFNLEIFSLNKNVRILNASKKNLWQTFNYIGRIDAALNISEIKRDFSTCKPKFASVKKLDIVGLYHPLIENCVSNDFMLENSSCAITGSNMSGKTSFMRSLGINALCAQSLGFCFAQQYSAPFFEICSSISVEDSIGESKSYYLEEILRVKEFLEPKENFRLILIDEIFTGTNTLERIAISKAVLKHLHSAKNLVIITTHDLEIAKYLENNDYELYYFQEEFIDKKLKFEYKITKGINTKTNAIRLLEIYNYPQQIVDLAYQNLFIEIKT